MGHEKEGDCWRICVHLNPEREKVTDSHRNFQLFLTDHTSALPLPAPLGLWEHCERCFKSPSDGGWGHSHTQEGNISCGFMSIHTVLMLASTQTQARADLFKVKKKKIITSYQCAARRHAGKRGSSVKNEMQLAADSGPSGCEELSAEQPWLRPVVFSWMRLLTLPTVVHCIKAVSGSMATFYNSYFYRERISKAQRISAGKDSWDKTNKTNLKSPVEGSLVFSPKCFSTTCRTDSISIKINPTIKQNAFHNSALLNWKIYIYIIIIINSNILRLLLFSYSELWGKFLKIYTHHMTEEPSISGQTCSMSLIDSEGKLYITGDWPRQMATRVENTLRGKRPRSRGKQQDDTNSLSQ